MNNVRKFKNVHDAHCCREHGCKYMDNDCPVVTGQCEGIRCEDCDRDEEEILGCCKLYDLVPRQKIVEYIESELANLCILDRLSRLAGTFDRDQSSAQDSAYRKLLEYLDTLKRAI